MKFQLLENTFLQKLSEQFQRSPLQLNQLLESDAELLRLADGSILAVTTDCIAEEIATGLYTDPAHIGWMTVVVNLSDLAAVGAQPLGLLLSESLPPDFPENKLHALQGGIQAACSAAGTYILGGDTNESKTWQMGATAIGLIPAGEPVISRKGSKAGDVLYASGTMGLGSAYAFSVLMSKDSPAILYLPAPRLKEGALVRQFGSSCIDTSDGFLHGLGNLMEINNLRFQVDVPFSQFTHPAAQALSEAKDLPAWVFLAGPHGEFELVFTIPLQNEKAFLTEAKKLNWSPLRLGHCTQEKHCTVRSSSGEYTTFDPVKMANVYAESGADPNVFLTQLLKLESSWQIQPKQV